MSELWLILLGLAGVAALVLMNALFVAAEFAYVGARRTRIEALAQQGQGRARLLLTSLRELDAYIATTQLGITLASLGLGWLGEPLLAGLIEPPVEATVGAWASDTATRAIGSGLAFLVITTALIVFGELAPKSLALARAESVALAVALPLAIFRTVFRPFVWVMNAAGLATVRAMGVHPRPEHEAQMDTEELELVIEASARAGLLSTSELLLARRALQFSAIQADQIMVPRTEVVAIDADATLEHVLDISEAHLHARYPVYRGTLDDILGVLEIKALLTLLRRGGTDWRTLVRPAAAIPETVSVEVAVAEMRAHDAQLLVLVDEHGGTSGILTSDEVLQRLLGRWLSGVERDREHIRSLASGHFLLNGLTLISDAEDATGVELADEGFDTVGGFVMAKLGRIPKVGDRVPVPGWEFRVTAMDGRRVARVLVMRSQPPGNATVPEE